MPGVNLTTSAKFLMPRTSILAAVKALMLSGTLLRFASLRVAVTTISPTLVAAEPPGGAESDAAAADPAHDSGTAATVIRQALNKAAVFVMFGTVPVCSIDFAGPSYSRWRPSRVCDHIWATSSAGAQRLAKLW